MWSIEKSKKLYRVEDWGQGYFSINQSGHICILPERSKDGPQIDLAYVIEEIKKQGLNFPVVIRFHDILRSQVEILNNTFKTIIEEAKFGGKFMGVYPIKVNQLREVVEEIMDAGAKFDYGLEAGSKTELLAALAYNTNKHSLTILNGHKDEEYIRLAMLGLKLGKKIIIVIEQFSELNKVIAMAKEMNVFPILGLRSKLSIKGSGKWAESTGAKAKFGLSAPQIIEAIELLKQHEMIESLKLFHFHIGSQIPEIRTFKEALTEGTRIYAEMVKLGAPLEYFDVGGGLGIDYEGNRSNTYSSVNYDLHDYIEDVVYILKQACDVEKIKHPHIITESGRFITAHHSCIVTNVFGSIKERVTLKNDIPSASEHLLVKNMRDLKKELKEKNFQEVFLDACQYREQSISAFTLGVLSLLEKAKIESLFWQLCQTISTKGFKDLSEEYQNILLGLLSEQYLSNFSVFQSAADTWAIDQVLPVMPISSHSIKPLVMASLVDITCDSDGKIKNYIGENQNEKAVPLHILDENIPYYVGIFLTGAYQDIIGDMHNLFGRVHEVHVFCDHEDPNDFYIEEIIPGNTAKQVLSTMQYNPEYMALTIKKSLDKQVKRGKIRPKEGVKLADFYESCLNGYTYLKK